MSAGTAGAAGASTAASTGSCVSTAGSGCTRDVLDVNDVRAGNAGHTWTDRVDSDPDNSFTNLKSSRSASESSVTVDAALSTVSGEWAVTLLPDAMDCSDMRVLIGRFTSSDAISACSGSGGVTSGSKNQKDDPSDNCTAPIRYV